MFLIDSFVIPHNFFFSLPLDAGMGELHTGQQHLQSGTDPESYFYLHVISPVYQPIGEVDCGYQAQYGQSYFGLVGLISLGRLTI